MLPISAKSPHFSRICLRVRDPGRSAEFYRTILEFASVQSNSDGNGNVSSVQKFHYMPSGFKIVFTEGLPPGDHLTGLDRISFEVSSRESVDLIYENARKRQARVTQPRLYEGHWQTFIFDPDGYKLEVFSRAQD